MNHRSIASQDRAIFRSMDSVLGTPAQQITRDSRSGVSRISQHHCYYVKVFNGPGNRLQHLLGISRYQRELSNLQYFKKLGLATPQLAAFGQRHHRGLLQDAVIVTREASDAPDLEKFADSGQLYAEGVAGAREILGKLAAAARTLHTQGFYHGDLKARNILVQKTADTTRLLFFDCPRGHHPPRFMLRRGIVRDLAHLEHDLHDHLRRVDMLYLYMQYRGIRSLSEADKALAREALSYYEHRRITRRRRKRIAAKQR